MRYAGLDLNTPIRWGGAWQCENICTYDGMIEDLQAWYLDHCFQQNMRPQLDVQHFELFSRIMEPYVYIILLFAGLIILSWNWPFGH